MPIGGMNLVLEKKYPYAQLSTIGEKLTPEQLAEAGHYTHVNHWFSERLRGTVHIFRDNRTGLHERILMPWNQATMIFQTMAASDAWLIEAEANALAKLSSLLPHHMFRRYLLTGAFIESSKRSRMRYIFRKLRPTIALAPTENDGMKIVCTLCMHPIGYYEGSWAGAMVPTDDVIAHLMLMRGDEHEFWKRCNQHSLKHPQSGL